MKMDQVASSQNDEFYTPEYAIKPILKYLKMPCTVWCPFDTVESNFVKMLKRYAVCGVSVVHTHIATGDDFFSITPPPMWLHPQQPALPPKRPCAPAAFPDWQALCHAGGRGGPL